MDDYIPFELLPKNRQQKKDSKIAYRHCFEVRPNMSSFKGDAEDNRLRRIFERDLIYVNPADFLPKKFPKSVEPAIVNYENVDVPHFFVGDEFKSFQLKCNPLSSTRWFAECTDFGLILKSPTEVTIFLVSKNLDMSKSVSIPIGLSELKRTSFRRLSSTKKKERETPINGFIVLVEKVGNGARLYGSRCDGSGGIRTGDEIIAVNDMSIEGKDHEEIVKYIQESIQNKVIQLKVRRKSATIEEEGPSEPTFTEAFLVSVDKENTKQLTKRIQREYKDIRVFDMESIASGKLQEISPANIMDNQAEEKEKLKKFEVDLRARVKNTLQRQKENEFLRSSIRASKKLQALCTKEQPKSDENECDSSYENRACEETSPIPLKQVTDSVDRLTEHLSRIEGSEEDARVLREFFTSAPIKEAIEATATERQRVANGVLSVHTNKTENETPNEENPAYKVVTLFKDEDSYLGATVRNEENRIVVGRVVKGGMVEKSGSFQEGDELIEMNGIDLRGKRIIEVCELLRNLSGEIRFVVSSSTKQVKRPITSNVQHFKALFDYDPEDDIYVPCKELGLKFSRGDVLHVLSTSDENWWQAYREGEEQERQLAGLIPSTSFHQQVAMYNEEIDRTCRGKVRKDAKMRIPQVIRTFGKKSGRDIVRSADEPPIHAMYNNDYQSYEEVVLHLTRSDHRRPLILCGPEGVGCLQLRQNLLEFDKENLATPIPYTSRAARDGEVDGVHYHFISRQQFQQDAKNGRFVEYGEYKKDWYGTSCEDITNVIKKGKTCVLTMKPESLYTIRTSCIMPYIVFISPPSMLQLKRQRELQGIFDTKDDQLKNIIAKGKGIEQKFGHLFDVLLVIVEFERTLSQLKKIVHELDTHPHWVPAQWINPS